MPENTVTQIQWGLMEYKKILVKRSTLYIGTIMYVYKKIHLILKCW